jgi:DEAD/DEAH box helicase domain-containing protein
MKQLIFDVETKKTFDQVGGYLPDKLGISFVGVIVRNGLPEEGGGQETRYELFEKDLDQLWSLLETADVIVGYNSDGFDLPALTPYYTGDITTLPSLDLMARIKATTGHRIGLDAVAQQTLGTQKIGGGLDAIEYYLKKDWDKLASYCMKDVEITRDLYDYGRQKGFVSFLNKWNNPIEAQVDFGFTPSQLSGVQMTLV